MSQSSYFLKMTLQNGPLPGNFSQGTAPSLENNRTHLPVSVPGLISHRHQASCPSKEIVFSVRYLTALAALQRPILPSCPGYKTGVRQVWEGLYWMAASQLPSSSRHLVTNIFPPLKQWVWRLRRWAGAGQGLVRLRPASRHLGRSHYCLAEQMEGESFTQVNPSGRALAFI